MVGVKIGMNQEFEQALKAHLDWRRENGESWVWGVYQVANGDNMGDYILRSGFHTWADFDDYNEFLTRAAAHFFKMAGPYINSFRGVITRVDDQNLLWPEDNSSVNLIQVFQYRVKIGKTRDLTEVISKVHQALVQQNWPLHYSWEWNANGGEGIVAMLILPFSSWESMQEPENPMESVLEQVYGKEQSQALFAGFADSVESVESRVFVVRRDLALIP